jgi:4-azaleucine resistance transporter AzlC
MMGQAARAGQAEPVPTRSDAKLAELGGRLVWRGFTQTLPIALFVLVFGAAFGLAAVQTGLATPWIVAMSAAVFAGASQFAVLDLWGPQVPIVTLAVTVFAINARHLLMGASLYPWLRHLPPARRYGVMVVASDANWAMAMQASMRGQPGLGLLFGGGLVMWLFWVAGTWLGTQFGGAIDDPRRWGLDMVMGCFLLAMVVDGPKNLRVVAIWIVAAASSLLARRYLPENSHVVVGALAGGILGAFWMEAHDER